MDEEPRWQGMSTDTDFSLWRVLDHARFIIARTREMELAKYDLTPEQSHVLDILQESNGSTTINQLVGITQRQHHSISTLIDRMEKQGLVSKQKAGIDRRKYEVVITDKGKELAARMSRDSIRIIFACLSEEDKKKLHSYLMQLTTEAYKMIRRSPIPGITARPTAFLRKIPR